ncbi:hypothetical protein AUP68_01185 [Ilyonectria robusta]
MASLRIPALRHLAASPLRATRVLNQRRWAQVHDIRFLATTRPAQAILDKYRAKLDQKAKTEGLSSIDELKAAYADKIEAERLKNAIEDPVIPQAPETPVAQPNADNTPITNTREPPKAPPTGGDKAALKALNDIIDLEKTRELPDKELTAIWRLRHASSPRTYVPLSPPPHTRPWKRPRGHLLNSFSPSLIRHRWTFDASSKTSTVLFTQLAEYKTRGEFAQPHTTITHHLDLADERGLVLMQGQVVDGRGVKPEEAKWLVMCLQRFYGGWESEAVELDGERKARAEERAKLLQWFAAGDSRFSLDKLMEEAERMG